MLGQENGTHKANLGQRELKARLGQLDETMFLNKIYGRCWEHCSVTKCLQPWVQTPAQQIQNPKNIVQHFLALGILDCEDCLKRHHGSPKKLMLK